MKSFLAPISTRSKQIERNRSATVPATDYSYKSAVSAASATPAKAQKPRVELTNFRTLSRSFFGAEAGREYVREAIAFGFLMIVAAWPLGVTLDMLGTMMMSPPPWGPW